MQFQAAISKAYSKLNYEQFCEVIGEPSSFKGNDALWDENGYALMKWDEFHKLCNAMSELGTMLDKLVAYGEQE